jgi:hypothetical protein
MRIASAANWKSTRPGRGLWGIPHGWWVVIGVLYLLSPIDAIPDFIPVLGQMDDLGMMVFLAYNAVQWLLGRGAPRTPGVRRRAPRPE